MISQFVSPYVQRKLGALNFDFPEGTNAVGRLDDESEGLLILTNDKSLTGNLLHPGKNHIRKYLVQVRNAVPEEKIERLRNGVEILIKERGSYFTQPCKINIIPKPESVPDREQMLDERVPSTWIEFILTEGKNRQIRKMCKAIGFKCYRLIRTQIEDLTLGNLKPGEVKEIEREELFRLLKL